MHWYLICLKHAADCFRDLRTHSIPYMQTAKVTVNEYGAVDLPADFESLVRIGYVNGQYVLPLVKGKGTMNRLVFTDESDNPIPYDAPVTNGFTGGWWLNTWFNASLNGQYFGGNFVHGAGFETDLYEIMIERNQIQVSQEMAGQELIFDYIGDINHPNNLTRIPAIAQKTIEQYIAWQLKENSRTYSKSEAKDDERMYKKERDILRANIDPLSKEDFLRIFRRGYHGGQKS